MSTTSMIAKIIKAAIAENSIVPTTGIDPIISPAVNANRIDKTNMIVSIQHLFVLCLQLV